MKTKKLLFTFLFISCSILLFSKNIDRLTAEKVAMNFFFERTNTFVNATSYNDLTIVSSKLVDDAYYIINFKNGWVLVSANDVMVPVLGYNYDGTFPPKEQQSDNFKSWMQHYVDQVLFIKENNIESDAHITDWEKYLTDDPQELIFNTNLDEVEPLLTSTWHQNFPYNIYCPEDATGPDGHTWAGCGATAMVQIMYYWRYPIHGSGSHYYYCYPYGDQSANFEEATYEWDAMQDNIDFDNPWEIAKITYHTAVSLNMNFGPDGSSSNIAYVPNALSTYFNYDTSAVLFVKDDFTLEVWEDMIREDLNIFRPVRYRGQSSNGGHAIVCDGYQEDPDYFHFNFGWSGNQNGYYTLDDLYGYNANQMLVKNIFPADPDYPYIAEGPDTLAFLSGSFTDGSGPAEDYPSGIEASWLIDPQSETDSVSHITLTFIQFNTAASDYLKVYDGEAVDDDLLGEFSGDELPEDITSSGNKMLVTFSSTGTGAGFKIEYSPTYPDYCENQQTYTEPSGTITDGSGTFYYTNLSTCIYTIECPSAIKYNIEFTSFSTEADNDIVTIYDGDQNVIGEFSGSNLPEFLEIETDMIGVTWSTNVIFNDEGWSFDYTVEGTGINENIIESNLSINPNPYSNSTLLEYELPQSSNVQINIYNYLGEKVKVLVNEQQVKGKHQVIVNGADLPAGIYFCVLKTNPEYSGQTKKMIKLK